MKKTLSEIESEWAVAEHSYSIDERKTSFQILLKKAAKTSGLYPKAPEPLILQACIILTRAKIESSLKALASVKQAKNLLEKAISINPNADNGSAFVTLGVLYYKVPGWPIAFGDTEKAAQMLKRGLKINPRGIDTNYFYAEFLLSQDQPEKAASYLVKSINAPIYKTNKLFAQGIQAKAKRALKELSTILAYNDHERL